MRENMGLYRGKRKDNGKWIEGSLLKVTISGETYYFIFCDDFALDGFDVKALSRAIVDPETIGEYSSLPDKNGKRIFEGDVFRVDEDDIAVVVFKDGCFRLEIHGLCGTFTESGFDECGGGYGVIECDPIDWYYVRDIEVIGNIHDNPELLEVSGDE